MALPLEQELKKLSVRAGQLAEQISDGALVTDERIVQNALALVIDQLQSILLTNLQEAITTTKEFNIPQLSAPLLEAFSNPRLIGADPSGEVIILENTLNIVGNENDFKDGIEAARSILGLKSVNTITQRADFWKNFIYRPVREGAAAPEIIGRGRKRNFKRKAQEFYSETIEARQLAWGQLVPYWYVLNYGTNYEGKSKYAHPRFRATNFILNSERVGTVILLDAIIQVNDQLDNIILREFETFLEREDLQIGEVIKRFFVDGLPFEAHVTSTGQFGVRKVR